MSDENLPKMVIKCSPGTRSRLIRLPWLIYLSLIFSISTGIASAWLEYSFDMKNWNPVDVPLNLSAGDITEADFVSKVNTLFILKLFKGSNNSNEAPDCDLDLERQTSSSHCPPTVHKVDLSWSVKTDNGLQIASGQSLVSYGDYDWTNVGRFESTRGTPYHLEVVLKNDAKMLASTSPRVRIISGGFKNDIDNAQLLSLLSFFSWSSLIFFIMVWLIEYSSRSSRHRT